MSEELKGDYECDECGYTVHDPIDKVCRVCGGELVYMMTWQDEIEILTKERNNLIAENKKLREKFQKLSDIPIETYTLGEIKDIAMVMRYIAQQALKEVTK